MHYNFNSSDPDSDQEWLVQKSSPLLELWKSPLSLTEFKILDLYLSRIDSRKPEQRWVRFEKGELERLLGVSQIKLPDLKKRLRNLYIPVDLPQADNLKGWHTISLFEQAVCTADDTGVWQIDLQCTQAAMKYIFNIENIGYLRYKLQTICSLTSRYSYILFLYLEKNRFRETWSEDLMTLKEILGCHAETYTTYKRFNQQVLQRCQRELSTKAECNFTYEPVRRGRTVYQIKFSMPPLDNIAVSRVQAEKIPLEESDGLFSSRENRGRTEIVQLLSSACIRNGEPEFSDLEIEHLLEILRVIPSSLMPQYTAGADMMISMYHYLAEKYAAMNRLDEHSQIRHRFAYLEHILKQDAGLV